MNSIKKSYSKVKHHNNNFETILDSIADGVFTIDLDFNITYFNSAAQKITGVSGDQALGQKCFDVFRANICQTTADESAGAMDIEKRRELIWEMQAIIMHDVPYFPLYNPRLTEGVRTDRFKGWVEMLDGIGNIWSFCRIRPK